MIQFKKLTMIGGFVAFSLALLFGYSNCGKAVTFQNTDSSYGLESFSSSITVGQVENNPPLDLFFVVDNSASMGQHQIDLGKAFANIFKSNSSALAKFDVNVYLFSTASTTDTDFLTQIPRISPSTVTSLPAANDFSNLVLVPGNIYGIWNSASGNYGMAPFSAQFYPAPVLGLDSSNNVTPSLFLAKKGSQSASSYATSIATLTANFQNRLAYLNPSNQIGNSIVSKSTDVSSALCTMARIAKHAKNLNFIRPGDSSAFIVVSDDNDRLNDRNPSNNQCADSIIGNDQLVDGTCAHYESTFTYNNSNLTVCNIEYQNGYKYTWTYTALKTRVEFTKCTQMADGFCLTTAPATQTINGNFIDSNGNCASNINSKVTSPAPDSTFTCSTANVENQTGTGVDADSNGSVCSPQLVTKLTADTTKQFSNCLIGSSSFVTKIINDQTLNSCTNYCASHPEYKNCSLLSADAGSAGTLKLNFKLPVAQTANCSTKCSDALNGSCDGFGFGASDNSTVADYIQQKLSGGTTCTSKITQVSGKTTIHVSVDSTESVCAYDPNTFFKVTKGPYANTQTNYVAGSSSHAPNDLINYIKDSLGSNSSVAVIGHLATDNLTGTNVSTDYLNLAAAMGSDQVSSISGDYSQALSDISNFIVQKTQNSFSLTVDSNSQVYSVSILRQSSVESQALSSSLWSWSGQTLTINPSVGLHVGDQILYQYH